MTGQQNTGQPPLQTNINTLVGSIVKLRDEIDSFKDNLIPNLFVMGDNMTGTAGHNAITKQVAERNKDLRTKKDILIKEIEKGEAVTERSNRDFVNVHDTVLEPQPKKTLNFIEDYTLAILVISYIFMILVIIYIYVSTSEFKLIAFGKALVGTILLSVFLFMSLFYIT